MSASGDKADVHMTVNTDDLRTLIQEKFRSPRIFDFGSREAVDEGQSQMNRSTTLYTKIKAKIRNIADNAKYQYGTIGFDQS